MEIPNKKYQIIYADPAWQYQDKGCNGNTQSHYKTMNVEEICKLPIKDVADKNCVLFLWATYPMLMEENKLWLKNVMEDLPKMNKIDYVITDPPYPNGRQLFEDSIYDAYAVLNFVCKITREKVIFFWSNIGIPLPPVGWYEIARHIWHKPNGQSATYYENIIVWSKEDRQSVSKVWRIPILNYETLPEYEEHPTQKPIKLMRAIVEFMTKEDDLILDPFAGTGTTLLACKQLNRRWVGYEINEDYHKIAEKRLKQTVMSGFFDTQVEPKAQSLNTDFTEDSAESPPKVGVFKR